MKKSFLFIFIIFLFSCNNSNKIKINNNKLLNKSIKDTIRLSFNEYGSFDRLYLISENEINKNEISNFVFYVGKKSENIFCIFLFDTDLFNFPTKEYTCKYLKNRKNFIKNYKRKGFEIYYDDNTPSYFIMINKKDTLVITGDTGAPVYISKDILLPQPEVFHIGESYKEILKKLNLDQIIKPKTDDFILMISHIDIIDDDKLKKKIDKIKKKINNNNLTKCLKDNSILEYGFRLTFSNNELTKIFYEPRISNINCLYFNKEISSLKYLPPRKFLKEY